MNTKIKNFFIAITLLILGFSLMLIPIGQGQTIENAKTNNSGQFEERMEKICNDPRLNELFNSKDVSDDDIIIIQEKANALFKKIPLGHDESTMFCKELFILIYEIFAILVGHNIVAWTLAFSLSCWFLIPAVMFIDIAYITIGDGGILDIFLIALFDLMGQFQDVFYRFGIIGGTIALCIAPFIIFIGLIEIILNEGFYISGTYMSQVIADLRYVFYPSNYEQGYLKYQSTWLNDMSTYRDDIYRLYYEIGLIGLCLYPFFLSYCFLEASVITVLHNLKYHGKVIYPE